MVLLRGSFQNFRRAPPSFFWESPWVRQAIIGKPKENWHSNQSIAWLSIDISVCKQLFRWTRIVQPSVTFSSWIHKQQCFLVFWGRKSLTTSTVANDYVNDFKGRKFVLVNSLAFEVEENLFEASWHIITASQVVTFGCLGNIVVLDLPVKNFTSLAFQLADERLFVGAKAELSPRF